MKKLIPFIILILIFGCKNSSENKTEIVKELDFNKHLTDQINYPLKKLNLKPITELKSKTLRIWKFPGGGAAFEQMIEFNKAKSELIFHSYLLEEYENYAELSKLNFSKIVNDAKLKNELNSVISNSDFINTKNSDEYCKPFIGCAELFLIEFTDGKIITKFTISHDIEKCVNPKAENAKRIFKIVNQILNKYSR